MSDSFASSPGSDAGARARAWLIAFPLAIPAAVFLAVAAIAVLSAYMIESSAKERSRAEVREYAQSIASSLDRRGNGFSSYLRAGAALYSTVDEVSPQTFRQFVAELRLAQNYRGAEGIGWIAAHARDDAPALLERIRQTQPTFPALNVQSVSGREIIAPVVYFYPDTVRNRRALGFDMYSEAVRAAAMDEAKRTVAPTASGRIVLAQEGPGEAPGFIIFMPVYKPVPGSPTQARELSGFLFGSFSAGDFLDAAIDRAAPASMGVRLYDGTATDDNLLVSRSQETVGSVRFEQPVSIANRELLLTIDADIDRHLSPLTIATLIFGLALASMLMLVLRLLSRQAVEADTRLAFLEEQNSIRNSLSRELNHRVKNTLANVLSMLSLTRARSSNLDEFADSLEGRIRALSATHDLLTGTDWGTVSIEAVIKAEMQHFIDADGGSLIVEGPPVELAPNDALSFGLAIHELGTNAAQYGALSVADGTVTVRWTLAMTGLATVEWIESGGPPVSKTGKRGFGLQLVEKITAHELKHRVELEFLPEGVHCTMGVPVREMSDFQMREPARNTGGETLGA